MIGSDCLGKGKQMKKSSKIIIGIIAGLIIGVITVVAVIFIFILLFFFGGPAKVTKDVDKYEETLAYHSVGGEGIHVRTEFLVFPDEIPASAFESEEKPEFYFWFKDTWDDPTCEVYLLCNYSEEDYNAEIERLRSVTKVFEDRFDMEKTLIYEDSERFAHPVYLAIDHNDFSYEYAMDLGDNRIVYIYTAWKTHLKNIKKIPEEYLPRNFEESLTSENGSLRAEGTFNIYIVPPLNEYETIIQYDFD